MIAVSSRVEVVLTAMLVCGLSGGVFMIVPLFISEICEESIRGALSSGTIISYGCGMLLSYILGGWLQYYTMVYVCLTLTVISSTFVIFLKETPTCLMIMGLEKEAEESMSFYRRLSPDSKEVQEELNTIRRSLRPQMDHEETPEEEKQLKPDQATKEKIGFFTFLKKSQSTRKAFYMVFTLVTASIFQGLVVVQVYAVPLFEEAMPNISANVASILLAVVGILSGFFTAYMLELLGRRPLMIHGSLALAAVSVLLGIQLHLQWGPSWLIAVNIYLFTCLNTFGGGTVPYVLSAEVFLPEVKSLMAMLVIEWAWACNSVTLFIFNPLLKAIGLGPIFYLFAGVSVLTGIYSFFYVPETKGLSCEAIQVKLIKKKKSGVTVY